MNLTTRIQMIQQDIHLAEKKASRPKDSVTLMAVSKQQPASHIREAYHANLTHFGENYLQEALPKIAELQLYPITWHFIGTIQTNKAKRIAQHFSWVHTVCSDKHADCLNAARPLNLPALNVCIQINLDNESSKGGATPEEAIPLAAHILSLPHLVLRGIMILPKPIFDVQNQLQSFLRAKQLLNAIGNQLQHPLDTLSMGMSQDYLTAIEAGSTIVRIGSAIFGKRKYD